MRDDIERMVRAPFTDDQVASLNGYQQSGVFHEYTCGTEKCREILVAANDGWHCPKCDYKQDRALRWMADWSWKQWAGPLKNPSSSSATCSG